MKTLAICMTKDEAPYVLEWVAYHRMIGFDEVLIVTNNNSDFTLALLNKLNEAFPWVHFIEHDMSDEKVSPQVKAYSLAKGWLDSREFKGIVGVIDIDEFVFLDRFHTLHEMFAEYDFPNVILLNWLIFGSSGKVKRPTGLVIENYSKSAEKTFEPHKNFKSLFLYDEQVKSFGPHFPRFARGSSPRYVYSDGTEVNMEFLSDKPYNSNTRIVLTGPRINHYVIKSYEEFLMKRSRGRSAKPIGAQGPERYNDNFFTKMDMNDMVTPMANEMIAHVRESMEEMFIKAKLAEIGPRAYFGISMPRINL